MLSKGLRPRIWLLFHLTWIGIFIWSIIIRCENRKACDVQNGAGMNSSVDVNFSGDSSMQQIPIGECITWNTWRMMTKSHVLISLVPQTKLKATEWYSSRLKTRAGLFKKVITSSSFCSAQLERNLTTEILNRWSLILWSLVLISPLFLFVKMKRFPLGSYQLWLARVLSSSLLLDFVASPKSSSVQSGAHFGSRSDPQRLHWRPCMVGRLCDHKNYCIFTMIHFLTFKEGRGYMTGARVTFPWCS